jgi:hypothetical protein
MDKLLEDSLKLAAEAAQAAYKTGYDEGYRAGAKWALAKAQEILKGDTPTLEGCDPAQHADAVANATL